MIVLNVITFCIGRYKLMNIVINYKIFAENLTSLLRDMQGMVTTVTKSRSVLKYI